MMTVWRLYSEIFRNIPRQRDFQESIPPQEAIDIIKDEFPPRLEDRYTEFEVILPYPDAFSWKITELVEVEDKYAPKAEKYFEETLFSGVAMAAIHTPKKGRRKRN